MFELPDLNGKLVVLRPLNIKRDLIGYFNVSLDEKIHAWVGNNIPKNIEEISELLRMYISQMYVWTIFSRETNEIIGIMRLSYPEVINGEITSGDSQRLHSTYWRKGYMKEARKLVYEFAYSNLKIETLIADVWEGNINSLESLKSVGYKFFDKEVEYFNNQNKTIVKYYLKLNLKEWYEKYLEENKDKYDEKG